MKSTFRIKHPLRAAIFGLALATFHGTASAAQTSELTADGGQQPVATEAQDRPPKPGFAMGLEAATLQFFTDLDLGPAFGGRLFGVYYVDKRVAVSGGFSWFLPAGYENSAMGQQTRQPGAQPISVPVDSEVNVKMLDLEGRYYFVGDMRRERTELGFYGAIGGALLFINESHSFDRAQYELSVSSEEESVSGFAIHGGLGLELKLGSVFASVSGSFGVPATEVNEQQVPIRFPPFAFAQAGLEYRFF